MGENKEYITYPHEKGSINISEDVIAVIAAAASIEVDGVVALSAETGREITDITGKKAVSKGVRIRLEENSVCADISVIVEAGCAINKVGAAVQEAAKAAIEASTGMGVSEVNVHISGVSFKRAK